MKHLKKIVLGAAALTCAASLGAQEFSPFTFMNDASHTNYCTAGVVKIDADNYMDVNNFSSVAPKTLFGTLGYENKVEATQGLNLGLAKNLNKNLYGAVLFTGNLGWNFSNYYTQNDVNNAKSSTYNATNTGSNFGLTALIGMKDLGIKVGFAYADGASGNAYSQTKSDAADTVTTNVVSSTVVGAATVGYNFKVGKNLLKTNVTYGMNFVNSISTDSSNSAGDVNDVAVATLVGGELFAVLPETTVKQELGTGLYFYFFGDNGAATTEKYGTVNENASIEILPAYALTFAKVKNLTLGMNVECPIEFTFASSKDVTAGVATEVKHNEINIIPALAFGLSYDVVPSKFAFNLGAGVTLPNMGWEFDHQTVDSSASHEKHDYNQWQGTDSPCTLALNSGFRYTIADTVAFDFYYDILGNLLNGSLKSNNTTWNNNANFWNTVNMVLVQNFGIKLSVKL